MKTKYKNKAFVIVYDTICDGLQCTMDDDKPALFTYDEAIKEIFDGAISMLENRTSTERKEVGVTAKQFKEMQAVEKAGNAKLMEEFLDKNPDCNYNNEFVEPAKDFILGRKAIFTGKE